MSDYWRGKTIAITGGSAGLGWHIAREAVAQHANVVLIARDEQRLHAAADRLQTSPSQVRTIMADVTQQADVDNVFRQVGEHNPSSLHAWVNCAGVSSRSSVMETTPEDFQRAWELNFLAAVRCTRAALPSLLANRGHLINIGSLASKSAAAFLGSYPATKFALAAYSQQLRLELGPQGVHVLLVCPGPIIRPDAGTRYDVEKVPSQARKPGGGVKLKGIDPAWLATRILASAEHRQIELIVPAKARLLFVINQLSPSWGDWLIRKMTT